MSQHASRCPSRIGAPLLTIVFGLGTWLRPACRAVVATVVAISLRARAWARVAAAAVVDLAVEGLRRLCRRPEIPVTVLDADPATRRALERQLRTAIRALRPAVGKVPAGHRVAVVVQYVVDGEDGHDGAIWSRAGDGGAVQHLIRLALWTEGRRLTATEVIGSLASLYISLHSWTRTAGASAPSTAATGERDGGREVVPGARPGDVAPDDAAPSGRELVAPAAGPVPGPAGHLEPDDRPAASARGTSAGRGRGAAPAGAAKPAPAGASPSAGGPAPSGTDPSGGAGAPGAGLGAGEALPDPLGLRALAPGAGAPEGDPGAAGAGEAAGGDAASGGQGVPGRPAPGAPARARPHRERPRVTRT